MLLMQPQAASKLSTTTNKVFVIFIFFREIKNMEFNSSEIVCLDVGGEIHYVRRGLLAR